MDRRDALDQVADLPGGIIQLVEMVLMLEGLSVVRVHSMFHDWNGGSLDCP